MRKLVFISSALVLGAATTAGAEISDRLRHPPKTPQGLERCVEPLRPDEMPRDQPGELFRYNAEVLGIDLGTVTVTAARRGIHEGQPVTEYRAWIDSIPLVRKLLSVDGRLASLVPDNGFTPVQSLLEYSFRSERYHERQDFNADGQVTAVRTRNGKRKSFSRHFDGPVLDFLSAFNFVRAIPAKSEGCALMFTDGKAYTVWLRFQGTEAVRIGERTVQAERYLARYGSDRSKKISTVDLWLQPGSGLLYRAKSHARFAPVFSLVQHRQAR